MRSVVVCGEAGCGKSRCVEVYAETERQLGMAVDAEKVTDINSDLNYWELTDDCLLTADLFICKQREPSLQCFVVANQYIFSSSH